MKPSKDALDEYKAMAKNSPGSMESKIKAHLVANCPKYDESRFDSCMQHLVDCAKEILGSRNGEVPDEVCYKICRDYFDDELWATEENKDDGDKEKEERRSKSHQGKKFPKKSSPTPIADKKSEKPKEAEKIPEAAPISPKPATNQVDGQLSLFDMLGV